MADELQIACSYSYSLYANDAYRICRYEYAEKPDGETRKDFIAKGNNLPEIKGTPITLYGQWKTDKDGDGKDRRSFAVSTFILGTPKSREGVINYFKFLKCGIGKDRAEAIYEKFQENTWYICLNQPERLHEVPGLSNRNIQQIASRLSATRTQMEVLQMFCGSNVPIAKVNRIVETLGPTAAAALKENPYLIARMEGFSFSLADTLALNHGLDPVNINRRKAAVIAALDQAAMNGHTCLPREELITKMMRILNCVKYTQLTREMCDAAIVSTLSERQTANTSGFIYTIERYCQERRIVMELDRLMSYRLPEYPLDKLNEIIAQYEAENHIKMADSQKEAVICAVTNPVSVVTGGPGTGKSTTAKAILYCQNVLMDGKSTPVLLSPTGKAARRLSESTGGDASTIHSALQLNADGNEADGGSTVLGSSSLINGDIILVDESSMADQDVTCELVKRVRTGCKLVFIGDPDQLPSVGCGNVLADLIRSKVIPTVKLSVIFRQAGDNPIVTNSFKIMQGDTDLLYNGSFVLMEMDDTDLIFRRAANMYVQSVQKYGIESTILLCPYRATTALNVNIFNHVLQDILNPKTEANKWKTMPGKAVYGITNGRSTALEFRVGDKVMQTVNTDVAKNGDTGFIRDICYTRDGEGTGGGRKIAKVEFNGDGVIHELDIDAVRDLDLAYCSTVHKSQGEEYKNVIMVMSSIHKQMLQRNLFYTGITRAKQNVLLVGEREAVSAAIQNNSITKRYTLLADRLHSLWRQKGLVA